MHAWKCRNAAPKAVRRTSRHLRSAVLFLGAAAANCNVYNESLLAGRSGRGGGAGVTDALPLDSGRGSGSAGAAGARGDGAGTTGQQGGNAGIDSGTGAGGALGVGGREGTGATSAAGGYWGAGGDVRVGGNLASGGAVGAGGAATGGAGADAGSSGGAGGATAAADAGGIGGTCALGTVRVEYKPMGTSTQVHYEIHVYGVSSAAIPLSQIEIRYYFTLESPSVAQTVSTAVSELQNPFQSGIAQETTIRTLSPPTAGADHYLQIRPDKGGSATLNQGQYYSNKGYLTVNNQIQTNDYSFGTQTTFANWSKIVVSVDGVQQWGCAP